MSTTATTTQRGTIVDINDLQLADETFDANVNQYERPAPPTPGQFFNVRLAFREQDPEKQFRKIQYNQEKYPEKEGKAYLVTELVGTIVDEGSEFQGRVLRDDFVSTGIFNRPTSAVASLLLTLGETLTGSEGHEELARMLQNAIASEPVVRVKSDWGWRGSKEAGYPRLKGVKNFPTTADGQPSHIIEDDAGEKTPAFGIIANYYAG